MTIPETLSPPLPSLAAYIVLEEAGRRLHVVQPLDLVAARRVQQAGQQLLAHVHLRDEIISVRVCNMVCRHYTVSVLVLTGQSGHENRKV